MQSASDLHYQIGKPFRRVAEHVLHNSTAFDARNHMLDHHPRPSDQVIGEQIGGAQKFAAQLFLGLNGEHVRWLIPLKAQVFGQLRAVRILNRFQIGHLFVVGLARVGLAQIGDLPGSVVGDDQVFIGLRFFLPL